MRYGLWKGGGGGGCTIVTVYMNPCHCVQCESETKRRQRPLGCSLAELVQVLDASKMFFFSYNLQQNEASSPSSEINKERELLSTQKTSQEHNNRDPNHLRKL